MTTTSTDPGAAEVFALAREHLAGCPGVDPNESDDNADSLVYTLYRAGYVTWPGRAPDREALILAVMTAQSWQSNEDGRSVSEYLVDTVILPLIAGTVGPSRPSAGTARPATGGTVRNVVSGDVTGSVVQGDRFGDVRFG